MSLKSYKGFWSQLMAKVDLEGSPGKSRKALFLHKTRGSAGTGGTSKQWGGSHGASWENVNHLPAGHEQPQGLACQLALDSGGPWVRMCV